MARTRRPKRQRWSVGYWYVCGFGEADDVCLALRERVERVTRSPVNLVIGQQVCGAVPRVTLTVGWALVSALDLLLRAGWPVLDAILTSSSL